MIVLRTLMAVILTLITFLIAGTAINMAMYYFINNMIGDFFHYPHFLRIVVGFFGAGVGIMAAKAICDAWVKTYSGKAITLTIVAINALIWIALSNHWTGDVLRTIEFAVESITAVLASALFWAEDPLKKTSKPL